MVITEVTTEVMNRFSSLITLFQAIGGLIVAYIIFNVISLWQNRKRRKDSEKMVKILEQINKKLDEKKLVKR